MEFLNFGLPSKDVLLYNVKKTKEFCKKQKIQYNCGI